MKKCSEKRIMIKNIFIIDIFNFGSSNQLFFSECKNKDF